MIEAWLQAKVENANRGRMMGTYRMVEPAQPAGAAELSGARAGLLRVSYQPAGAAVLRGAAAPDACGAGAARDGGRPKPSARHRMGAVTAGGAGG